MRSDGDRGQRLRQPREDDSCRSLHYRDQRPGGAVLREHALPDRHQRAHRNWVQRPRRHRQGPRPHREFTGCLGLVVVVVIVVVVVVVVHCVRQSPRPHREFTGCLGLVVVVIVVVVVVVNCVRQSPRPHREFTGCFRDVVVVVYCVRQ